MASIAKPIPLEELADLPTKRLLGIRYALLACEASIEISDVREDEIDPEVIRFKDDPRWGSLYAGIKAELAGREHVPGGDERRQERRDRAREQRTRDRRRRM